MAWLCGGVLVGLFAAHVLASPTAGSDMHLGTTVEQGFFKRLFHGLGWKNSPAAAMTAAPTLSSPSTSTQTSIQFRVAEPKEFARVNFSLRLLSEDFHQAVEPGTYTEGSVIHLEARVHTSRGLFPKIFVDECFGTVTRHWQHAQRVYLIVDNHGCLYPGELETKATGFRKDDSTIVLTIPAFLLTCGPEEKVYIHCLLSAWSQRIPTNPGKKTCYFDGFSSRWKNIDEPSKASVCSCCDSYCPSALTHPGSPTGEGRLHRAVVGPLIMQKADIPWFEAQCRTMKKLMLVSLAFVCSCVLAILFVGALLVLASLLLRYSCTRKGLRLLESAKEQPFHTELQTVVGAITEVDETEEESNLDYCKLKADTPKNP